MHEDLENRFKTIDARISRLKKRNIEELNNVVKHCIAIEKEFNPTSRGSISKEERLRLYNTQNGICPLCDAGLEFSGAEADHIIAFANCGGNEYENFQMTHRTCNRQKGDRNQPIEVVNYLEQRLDQRFGE